MMRKMRVLAFAVVLLALFAPVAGAEEFVLKIGSIFFQPFKSDVSVEVY